MNLNMPTGECHASDRHPCTHVKVKYRIKEHHSKIILYANRKSPVTPKSNRYSSTSLEQKFYSLTWTALRKERDELSVHLKKAAICTGLKPDRTHTIKVLGK